MNNSMFSKCRGPFIGLIFFVVLLFLGEGAGYLLAGTPGRLERIHAILEQDARLFWKQKPNLDVMFEGARVKTNQLGLRNGPIKDKTGQIRIICLGASPTFGWGVEQNEVYAKQLEQLLQKSFTGKNIEVINAGQIGYSSFQGQRFFKEKILSLSPDIITVAYVINDVDKYRFYRSDSKTDKDLGPKNATLVAIENFLDKSKFFAGYKKLILRAQSLPLKYFGQQGAGEYVDHRRVSAQDYHDNLKDIIKTAKANGIEVVLLKLPVNLPAAQQVSIDFRKEADEKIDTAITQGHEKKFQEALAGLKEALMLNPNSARAYYYLGQFSLMTNQATQAEEYFKKTVLMELYECQGLAAKYNSIMQDIAREERLVLVDIVREFADYSRQNKEYLFLDPDHDTIHPNKLGHALIGRALFRTLIENKLFHKIS